MSTNELIKAIQKLPVSERIYIVEKTMQIIRTHEDKINMKKAADSLLTTYKIDTELTAFSDIDFEDFYGTK